MDHHSTSVSKCGYMLAVLLLFALIVDLSAQGSINYNSENAPTGEANLIAQANQFVRRNPAMDFMFGDVRMNQKTIRWENAVGSPYLNTDFLPCKVYVNEEVVGDLYYRHNAYNDEIEIKDYLEQEQIRSLVVDKRFRLVDGKKEISLKTLATKKNGYRNGYLNLLFNGERFKLYSRVKMKFTEGTQPVNSLVRPTPDKFTKFMEYYYADSTKEMDVAFFMEQKKKKFINLFDEPIAANLKMFLKEQKINLKKEEDLIKTFAFLNTL